MNLLRQAEDFTQRLLKSQQEILERDNHEQAKEYQKKVLTRARQRSKREDDDSTAEVRVSKRKSQKKERDSFETYDGPPEPVLNTQYLC